MTGFRQLFRVWLQFVRWAPARPALCCLSFQRCLARRTPRLQGVVRPEDAARVAAALHQAGCYEVSMGDTIGVGTPASGGMGLGGGWEGQPLLFKHLACYLPASRLLPCPCPCPRPCPAPLLAVVAMFEACVQQGVPVSHLAAHMHDTYGQALANILAALQLGVATVDASGEPAREGGCRQHGRLLCSSSRGAASQRRLLSCLSP